MADVDKNGESDRPTLRVDSAVKRFGGVIALDGVSLVVHPGEAVAVIGPNGAGKSTLLKLMAGTYRLTSGSVHLGTQRLDNLGAHLVTRRGIALAYQVPRPFSQLTVRENVMVAAQARPHESSAGTWVDAILDRCGLLSKSEVAAGDLRLLDLKRLELARALATSPEVLLLDEVAAGLVGRELHEIIELIRSLHRDGRSIVLVEHVEGVVASLVERVVVLDWGRVVAEGTPAEIEADPKIREIYLGAGVQAKRRLPAVENTQARNDAGHQERSHNEPLLALDAVSAGYGDLVALRAVDLVVEAAEVVAVLGANGAGKTTLAGTISGLLRPRAGRIRFAGVDITDLPVHKRARSGIVLSPEGRRVFSDLTVRENLSIAVSLRSGRRQLRARIDAVHSIFPVLSDLGHTMATALSGGQQQMLAIGRALMSDPQLLVCDEISLGLAPVMVDKLYEALEQVRRRGVAIVLIEQNVHRGLEFADRAYVLSRGAISYAGDPERLLDEAFLDSTYFGVQPSLPTAI